MKSIDIRIYAKINLSLNIVGLADGMHLLDSVVASVDLYDAISICLRRDNEVNIRISDEAVDPYNNSVTKAIAAIKKQLASAGQGGHGSLKDFGADIYVKKGIPIGGGLGGSSADAAGVIVGLDRLLKLGERGVDIKRAAAETGSDTVYMLEGGYARMRGTGNEIERIESNRVINLVLASPNEPSCTAAVFREFDQIYREGALIVGDNEALIESLKCGDIEGIARNVGNALYEPAIRLRPRISEVFNAMEQLAVASTMTGSGSMIVGVFQSRESAKSAVETLKRQNINAIEAKTLPKLVL